MNPLIHESQFFRMVYPPVSSTAGKSSLFMEVSRSSSWAGACFDPSFG